MIPVINKGTNIALTVVVSLAKSTVVVDDASSFSGKTEK
jgi:hypothetical protein